MGVWNNNQEEGKKGGQEFPERGKEREEARQRYRKKKKVKGLRKRTKGRREVRKSRDREGESFRKVARKKARTVKRGD